MKTKIETKKINGQWKVVVNGKQTDIDCEKCIHFIISDEHSYCEKEKEIVEKYGLFCGNICGDFEII